MHAVVFAAYDAPDAHNTVAIAIKIFLILSFPSFSFSAKKHPAKAGGWRLRTIIYRK